MQFVTVERIARYTSKLASPPPPSRYFLSPLRSLASRNAETHLQRQLGDLVERSALWKPGAIFIALHYRTVLLLFTFSSMVFTISGINPTVVALFFQFRSTPLGHASPLIHNRDSIICREKEDRLFVLRCDRRIIVARLLVLERERVSSRLACTSACWVSNILRPRINQALLGYF